MSKKMQLWLLFRAHVLGDLDALHNIAAYYAYEVCEHRLAHKYLIKAFRYYRYGAERGNPGCQYDYGFMLIVGDAGIKDEELGLSWIKKAADADYPSARKFLAEYST